MGLDQAPWHWLFLSLDGAAHDFCRFTSLLIQTAAKQPGDKQHYDVPVQRTKPDFCSPSSDPGSHKPLGKSGGSGSGPQTGDKVVSFDWAFV